MSPFHPLDAIVIGAGPNGPAAAITPAPRSHPDPRSPITGLLWPVYDSLDSRWRNLRFVVSFSRFMRLPE